VAASTSPSVATINFNPVTRWLLVLPAIVAIFGAWYVIRWYVGNTIAEYSSPVDQGGMEMAKMASRWAPDDPLTHLRLAVFDEQAFSAENMAQAVEEYKLAVRLSPNDYRNWMALGRALEANGDPEGGEKALRHAVELAPAYSYPRWYYGNLLLRQGKTDEAFVQLSKAADVDEAMRFQVFNLALHAFEGNLDQVVKAVPSPAVRMQFAIYFIDANQFDNAARILDKISESDRREQSALTQVIIKSLLLRKQFHAALTIMRELEPDPSQLAVPERVSNGGFEEPLPPQDQRPFHWLLVPKPRLLKSRLTIRPTRVRGACALFSSHQTSLTSSVSHKP